MVWALRVSALVSLAGCQVLFPLDPPATDGHPADARADAPRQLCFGQGLVQLCLAEPAGAALDTGGNGFLIDTDTSPSCVAYTPVGEDSNACVVAASKIVVGGTARAVGTRPLVLISESSITIDGTLDAASKDIGDFGAGANPLECPILVASNRAGGVGGSFGDIGGIGARPGAAVPDPAMIATRVRGGCGGGGGSQSNSNGGAGGGAVYLIATSIVIHGGINVSGMGGLGGVPNTVNLGGGGGGGGAGGMIGLDGAIAIDNLASVVANGGGGGEGGGSTGFGCHGDVATGIDAAAGGFDQSQPGCGAMTGGDGGKGGSLSTTSGLPGKTEAIPNNTGGGGGGGGGVGVIRVFPPQVLTGSVSPAPT